MGQWSATDNKYPYKISFMFSIYQSGNVAAIQGTNWSMSEEEITPDNVAPAADRLPDIFNLLSGLLESGYDTKVDQENWESALIDISDDESQFKGIIALNITNKPQ